MGAAGLLGVVLERVAFRPLRGSHPLVPLISAIGASIFLQSLALLLFGPNDRPFPVQFTFSTVNLAGVPVSTLQIAILAAALGFMGLLVAFVRYTTLRQGHRGLRPGPGHRPSHGHQRGPHGGPDLSHRLGPERRRRAS